MNREFFTDNPLVLDRNLAKLIGLNEAIVLNQVNYWIQKNKENNRNYHEGRYWTYNTYEEWTEEFPFWSKDTIKRTFKKLRDMGLIITGRFNIYQMDRTLWYTIDYEKLDELKNIALMEEGNINPSIDANSSMNNMKNATMDECNLTPAIPETSSENTTDILNQSINLSNDGPMTYLDTIIEKCALHAVDEDYRDATEEAIRMLFANTQNSDKVKIGENFIPAQIVLKNLTKLDFFVVSHAIDKFKDSARDKPIRNPVSYLKTCIYNAIFQMKIDLDARLRYDGMI